MGSPLILLIISKLLTPECSKIVDWIPAERRCSNTRVLRGPDPPGLLAALRGYLTSAVAVGRHKAAIRAFLPTRLLPYCRASLE
jgi:hypothetical protein